MTPHNFPSPDDKAETVADLVWNSLDVSPLEMLELASTRRRDPELALRIAGLSADQYVHGPLSELETRRFLRTGAMPQTVGMK